MSASREFSESARTSAEIKRYADGMADMFCAYVGELGRQPLRAMTAQP